MWDIASLRYIFAYQLMVLNGENQLIHLEWEECGM
jgi:hypothetical protein